jgi:hypothetical protein
VGVLKGARKRVLITGKYIIGQGEMTNHGTAEEMAVPKRMALPRFF